MTLLDYLIAVVPMLGILIFVHEFGHFAVAKACGVRVLKFSLGFGSPIGIGRFRLRWERAGTEYVIAWFPLGGFVKMLGDNPFDPEQGGSQELPEGEIPRPDEYLTAKPTWQKLAIVFAGPAMNLLLPVVVFAVVLVMGMPRAASVVGTVEPSSPAATAGLSAGDRILSVDGVPVEWWQDVDRAVREHPGRTLAFDVEREGQPLSLMVPVQAKTGLDEFGGVAEVGWAGLDHRRLPTLLGIPSADSPAALASLQSGDRVTAVAGQPVEDWETFRRAYEGTASGSVLLALERGRTEPQPVEAEVPALGDVAALGVVPATILVHQVVDDSPAAAAGLEPGDLIVAVNGQPVGTFASFQETVRASEGRPLTLGVARNGESLEIVVTPDQHLMPTGIGIEEKRYRIGIMHALATLPGVVTLDQEPNPIVALPRAAVMTVEQTVNFLRGLARLLSGDLGRDKITGPLGIAEIARKSLDVGFEMYLTTMILISINLAILNLLPIPILDGGQALLFAIEGIRRSPVSIRTREIVQQIGFTVLVMLMGLAFWNDLSRKWAQFVEWVRGLGL
ncbi:MAG: RIP metalloprotease RseP [Proteobacteria bacterium]|nr:RIP metalloprotease RseP [Pseudomonadota bacterium]